MVCFQNTHIGNVDAILVAQRGRAWPAAGIDGRRFPERAASQLAGPQHLPENRWILGISPFVEQHSLSHCSHPSTQGQNTLGTRLTDRAQWEKPLGGYCDDSTFDIFIVSFMHIFYNGNPPLPGLNFAYHCENAPYPGYPYLLVCPAIAGKCARSVFHGDTLSCAHHPSHL